MAPAASSSPSKQNRLVVSVKPTLRRLSTGTGTPGNAIKFSNLEVQGHILAWVTQPVSGSTKVWPLPLSLELVPCATTWGRPGQPWSMMGASKTGHPAEFLCPGTQGSSDSAGQSLRWALRQQWGLLGLRHQEHEQVLGEEGASVHKSTPGSVKLRVDLVPQRPGRGPCRSLLKALHAAQGPLQAPKYRTWVASKASKVPLTRRWR